MGACLLPLVEDEEFGAALNSRWAGESPGKDGFADNTGDLVGSAR